MQPYFHQCEVKGFIRYTLTHSFAKMSLNTIVHNTVFFEVLEVVCLATFWQKFQYNIKYMGNMRTISR